MEYLIVVDNRWSSEETRSAILIRVVNKELFVCSELLEKTHKTLLDVIPTPLNTLQNAVFATEEDLRRLSP